MPTLREEAEFLRLGLAMGLVETGEAVAWADARIAELDAPPIEVIDVSLGGGMWPDEMIALLGKVPGGGDLAAAAHRVLGLMRKRFRAGGITFPQAAEMAWAYSAQAAVPDGERREAYELGFNLSEVGYSYTREGAADLLAEFLDRFAQDPNDPNREAPA